MKTLQLFGYKLVLRV